MANMKETKTEKVKKRTLNRLKKMVTKKFGPQGRGRPVTNPATFVKQLGGAVDLNEMEAEIGRLIDVSSRGIRAREGPAWAFIYAHTSHSQTYYRRVCRLQTTRQR